MNKCVFAGSFDPITNGHLEIIKKATILYDQVVVGVLVNWDKQYHFSQQERIDMVQEACKNIKGVSVKFFGGTLVDFLKQENTNVFVRGVRNERDIIYENLTKEYNKKSMPNVQYVYICSDNYVEVSSTKIKEKIIKKEEISSLVPNSVLKYL